MDRGRIAGEINWESMGREYKENQQRMMIRKPKEVTTAQRNDQGCHLIWGPKSIHWQSKQAQQFEWYREQKSDFMG